MKEFVDLLISVGALFVMLLSGLVLALIAGRFIIQPLIKALWPKETL